MRIMHLISQTRVGGAENFAFTLCEELARRGHDVSLVANRMNGSLFERQTSQNLRIRALSRRNRMDPRILSFLTREMREFKPQVLHSHNFQANTWARTLGLFYPKLDIICHEHAGRKSEQRLHRTLIDAILFRRCSTIFTVNEEIRNFLDYKCRLPARSLVVLPNGIDIDKFTENPDVERNPKEAVCVARFNDVKNHRGLVSAWSRVVASEPSARLTLVGDGILRQAIEKQVNDLGLWNNVHFAGLQSDVRPYLWRASLFVMFSRREGMPVSLLEAMACGLACVCTKVGGIPTMIGEGVGRLVQPGDIKNMAAVVTDLMADQTTCRRLGTLARERVASRYSLSACVDLIEQKYSDHLVG